MTCRPVSLAVGRFLRVEFPGSATDVAADLVRLIAVVVIVVATVRPALGVASTGRTR